MWNAKDIDKLPEWAKTQIRNQLAGDIDPKQKCSKQKTLDIPAQTPTGMVNIAGSVLVRITRVGKRRLDSDNMSGGCKELRDSIAAMLGRKGDSEKDGMSWEYCQEKGEPETRIEIYEILRK